MSPRDEKQINRQAEVEIRDPVAPRFLPFPDRTQEETRNKRNRHTQDFTTDKVVGPEETSRTASLDPRPYPAQALPSARPLSF